MASVVNAHLVDPDMAKKAGAMFLKTDNLQFVKSYPLNNGDAAFYVFNTENGFIIVSADDSATPILAYSNEEKFDKDNVPVQMQTYLDGFVEQIQFAVDHHIVADEYTAHQWESVMTTGLVKEQRSIAVGPLLTSTWNQGFPYNMSCPEIIGGHGDHAPTGCVATAMGQIMRYWRYPETGQGSHGGIDFSNTTYRWDEMFDAITTESDTSEIIPISTLLWHCGVSVDTYYDMSVSDADVASVPDALVTYFNYSPDNMVYEFKACENDVFYTDEEWLAKVKACLDLGRPLLYGAFTDETYMGHAFVCDGYDENDMLHFNWGWSGNGDAFFALGAMNITLQSGYTFYFNTCNCAIFNIHPKESTGVEELFDTSEAVSYEVYDVLGCRADGQYKNHRPGVYIIRLMMKSGDVVTQKVVLGSHQ